MKKAGVFIIANIVWLIAASCGWAADFNPAAAYDPINDQYLVVYEQEIDSSTYMVTCQRVSSNGIDIGDPFDVFPIAVNFPPTPSVVYHAADGQFLVVWQQDAFSIYGRFITPEGGFGSNATIISDETAYPLYAPALAYSATNGQSLVIWPLFDSATSQYIIVGKRVILEGGALSWVDGTDVHIADHGDGVHFVFPCVTYNAAYNRFLVAWSQIDYLSSNLRGLGASFVSAEMEVLSILSVPAGDASQFPAAAYDSANDRFLMVWMDETTATDYNILGATILSDGTVNDPIVVAADSGNQLFPAVAFDTAQSRFMVTWADLRSASTLDIYGQWVTNGALDGTELEVAVSATGDQQAPAMAYNTTLGNMLTAYSSDPTGDAVIEYAITSGGTVQTGDYSPATAYDPINNRHLVVYERYISADEAYSVTAQLVDGQGATIGTPFDINTTAIAYQSYWSPSPAVVYDAVQGQFLVVWIENYSNLYGRYIGPDGAPVTDATLIADNMTSDDNRPAAAYNPANGQSLVVWSSYDDTAGYQFKLVGKRITLVGNSLAPADVTEITIATDPNYDFIHPGITVDTANGGYMIAWSRIGDATSFGLGFALVTAEGQAFPPETPEILSGEYYSPAVAFDNVNGNYLLTWQDGANPSDYNIGGAVVSADGNDITTPFIISEATGNQGAPAVAFDAGRGGSLVAWEDNRTGNLDIYGQWITNGLPDGLEFEIAIDAGNQYSPAISYNTICANMLTAFTSSVTGLNDDNVIGYTVTGTPCPTGAEAIVPAGATVADYRMITFPVTAQPDIRAQIVEHLGEPDPTQWRMLRWNPASGAYMEITDDGWSDDQACVPGRAYWIISRPGTTLTVHGIPSPDTGDVEVVLKPGWNQIGSPYSFSVLWNGDITVTDGDTVDPVDDSTMISASLWQYNNGGGYTEASVLVQGRGYWIQNTTNGDLTLTIPANRYITGIWNNLRQMVARWTTKFPRSAVAAGSTPPPPPGALEADPDSNSSGCFISTTTFFKAD